MLFLNYQLLSVADPKFVDMARVPMARRFAVWGDELPGYDKPKLEDKWWFDLEDVNGVMEVPKYAGDRGNHKDPGR
jgi:hypothetical protein